MAPSNILVIKLHVSIDSMNQRYKLTQRIQKLFNSGGFFYILGAGWNLLSSKTDLRDRL